MIKKLIRNIVPSSLYQYVGTKKNEIRAWIVGFDPKKCMSMFYKNVFHEDIDWENPKNLIEKINWLQLYSDTSLWTICADKYQVREFVEERGLKFILNELYGEWNRAEDIDWSKLPNQFVLKTTQGCGEVIIVKDKSLLDINKVKRQLNKWLKEKYGLVNGQSHYTRIKPRIIAERLLINREDPSKSLIDYKIWCFNGEPEFIFVVYDRIIGKQYHCSGYDLDWHDISGKIFNKNSEHFCGREVQKPIHLKEMLEIAKTLSNGFPEVRIDLYEVEGQIIFGEMTFTTGFGYFTKEFYNYLGEKVQLNSYISKN